MRGKIRRHSTGGRDVFSTRGVCVVCHHMVAEKSESGKRGRFSCGQKASLDRHFVLLYVCVNAYRGRQRLR